MIKHLDASHSDYDVEVGDEHFAATSLQGKLTRIEQGDKLIPLH